MSLKWKVVCTAIALAFSAIFIYPTIRWISMSPERREALQKQWDAEPPVRRGSGQYYARALRRWAQGDRDRVINLGLDLQGGVHLLYEIEFPPETEDQREAVANYAVEVIRNRVDQYGVREPVIQLEGARRILVQLPGVKDPDRMKGLIGQPAQLKFHIVEGPDTTRMELDKLDRALDGKLWPHFEYVKEEAEFQLAEEEMNAVKGLLEQERDLWPQDYVFAFGTSPPPTERNRVVGLYLMKEKEEMTGENLTTATAGPDTESLAGGFQVNLRFNARGAQRFGAVTSEHVGERLGAVIDNRVKSAPTIREEILTGSAKISGRFTFEDAQDLAIALRSGALPASLREIEERTVGPTLGTESIQKGVRAALIGLTVVILFMIVYYRLAGLIATVALLLNILIIMAVLACLQATLTLPGIAGIILTMGMAVDANVLIFERIREELRKGKTIRAAIETGYSRAFLTIIDANVTTLIAALVLFQFGTGPVKGFAVTLSIGIFASVFTAIVVTRLVFDLLTKRRTFRTLSMMSFVKTTNLGFIGKRRYAFAASIAVILLGMSFFVVRGKDNFGIDFVPGTILQMRFTDDTTTGQVREALVRAGIEDAVIQSVEGTRDILIRTSEYEIEESSPDSAVDRSVEDALKSDPSLSAFTVELEEHVGPAVGKELQKDAFLALLIAIVAIIIYISFRFEFRFALAAVVALFHDVLVTTGCFALPFLGRREISLPVVAALLTIVGYSLNDTIVVFDRIRENLKALRGKKYSEILNVSINQTLSRTLLTSLTTLIVVLSLYLRGGVVIHNFAFAMLVGVIVGTYSSIFVASPLLVAWHRRRHG